MRRDYPVPPPPVWTSCAIGLRKYPCSRPLASHLGLVPTPIFPSRLLPIPPSTLPSSTLHTYLYLTQQHQQQHHSNTIEQRSNISYRTHIYPHSLSGHGNRVQLHQLLYWGCDLEEVLTTTHDLTVYHLSKATRPWHRNGIFREQWPDTSEIPCGVWCWCHNHTHSLTKGALFPSRSLFLAGLARGLTPNLTTPLEARLPRHALSKSSHCHAYVPAPSHRALLATKPHLLG